MGESTNAGRDGWIRMQVYVPPDFFEVIKERAAQRATSVSAEGLRLMRIGLANVKPNENLAADLTALRRWLELHLEPLVFVAAMDAAFGREAWQWQIYSVWRDRRDEAARAEREFARRAAARLQRQLRGVGDEGGAVDGGETEAEPKR